MLWPKYGYYNFKKQSIMEQKMNHINYCKCVSLNV